MEEVHRENLVFAIASLRGVPGNARTTASGPSPGDLAGPDVQRRWIPGAVLEYAGVQLTAPPLLDWGDSGDMLWEDSKWRDYRLDVTALSTLTVRLLAWPPDEASEEERRCGVMVLGSVSVDLFDEAGDEDRAYIDLDEGAGELHIDTKFQALEFALPPPGEDDHGERQQTPLGDLVQVAGRSHTTAGVSGRTPKGPSRRRFTSDGVLRLSQGILYEEVDFGFGSCSSSSKAYIYRRSIAQTRERAVKDLADRAVPDVEGDDDWDVVVWQPASRTLCFQNRLTQEEVPAGRRDSKSCKRAEDHSESDGPSERQSTEALAAALDLGYRSPRFAAQILAAGGGDVAVAQALLEGGALCDFEAGDVHSPPLQGWRECEVGIGHSSTLEPRDFAVPLLRAIRSGNVELVRLLLEHGADTNNGFHGVKGRDDPDDSEKDGYEEDEGSGEDSGPADPTPTLPPYGMHRFHFHSGQVVQLAMELGHDEMVDLLLEYKLTSICSFCWGAEQRAGIVEWDLYERELIGRTPAKNDPKDISR
ncbi:hypothetical protein PG988_011054 [Apiospora saccharicola]